MPDAAAPAIPRLTYLRIKNYRALRDVELRDLTPLTVLIGPNGSGKSTVLDALDFLAEAVRGNLVQAWEKRDRFRGMRTRGVAKEENIEFSICFLHSGKEKTIYIVNIGIDEFDKEVGVISEKLVLNTNGIEKILFVSSINPVNAAYESRRYYKDDRLRDLAFTPKMFKQGQVFEVIQDESELQQWRVTEALSVAFYYDKLYLSEAIKNINSEGLFTSVDYFLLIVKILESYRLLHLTDDHLKGFSDQGPRERLSPNGDNLPNVLYYLHERHPEVLARISGKLREWVPGLAEVITEVTSDERLLLRFRDTLFEKPLPAQYMSGGTMRLAALLVALYEPGASGILGIEEPENELHPQLLPRLAEELEMAAAHRQLLVATHSPFLLDALEPEQVWILHRGPTGYTQATRAADMPHVKELVEDGSPLGYLWSSNSLAVANPLNPAPDAR